MPAKSLRRRELGDRLDVGRPLDRVVEHGSHHAGFRGVGDRGDERDSPVAGLVEELFCRLTLLVGVDASAQIDDRYPTRLVPERRNLVEDVGSVGELGR